MRQTGTVKFFKPDGGYGFIAPDHGDRDIFVHMSDLRRVGLQSLAKGQRVSFLLAAGKEGKGPKAIDVAIAERK